MQDSRPTFTNSHSPIKSVELYQIGNRSFTSTQLAKLAGAPDGTKFKFVTAPNKIHIYGENEIFLDKTIHRMLAADRNELSLLNVQFSVRPEYRRNGVGFKMLNSQLIACRALKIPYIRCFAARWEKNDLQERVELDGYMVWPKLGFDGEIPHTVVQKLGKNFTQHATIQDLLQTEGGTAEWKLHGDGCRLTFETNSDSVHSGAFEAYGKKKGFLSS